MAFICNLCLKQFNDRSNITQHFLTEHSAIESESVGSPPPQEPKILPQPAPTTNLRNNSICVCEICFKSAPSRISLSNHILSHVGAMPYFCKPCLFATLSKQKFRQHSKHSYVIENDRSPHECDLCDGMFSTLPELVCHYAHHLRAMPFICKICKVMFSEKKDFTIHNHLHKNSLECDICHFTGTSLKNLLQHVLSHNPTKYFKEIRYIVSSLCLGDEFPVSHECNQSVTKSLDSEQQSVTKSLESEQQSVTKSIDSEQQSISKPLESEQQSISKPLESEQLYVPKSLYCSNVCVTKSDDKIPPRNYDVTKGTCLQKNNLVSRGTYSIKQFVKIITSKGSYSLNSAKPIQTSPQSKINHSNPIATTDVASRSLLLPRTLHGENSNLSIQPERNNSIAQIPKKNMIVLQKLPIGGNPGVKDSSSSNERYGINGIRNLCSRINNQNDQSNDPSTKVQDSNSSTETFIIKNLYPRVNNLTTQNDQPNNLSTEVQDPRSSNENNVIQNLLPKVNHLKDQNGHTNNSFIDIQDPSLSSESNVVQNSCSKVGNLKDQNDPPNNPSTEIQNSNSSNESNIQKLCPRFNSLSTENDHQNNPSFEVQDSSSTNESNAIRNLRSRVNSLKAQKHQLNNPTSQVQNSSSANESNVIRNFRPRVNNLKDKNGQSDNQSTEFRNSSSSNESNVIRNLRSRVSNLKAPNNRPKKSRVCKQQKKTRYMKAKPLNAPIPYQNQSEDPLLGSTENPTAFSVDAKPNEICIAQNLKQCKVILDRLPDYITSMHLLDYNMNTPDTNSKPKSPKSKEDFLDLPSLINVDDIKTEITSDDEIDSPFLSLKNTVKVARAISVSDCKNSEISSTSSFCPNSSDCFIEIGERNTNSGESTSLSESEPAIIQVESLIKSFASRSNKSISSSKFKSKKRKHLPLSKILPKPSKLFKETSNKLKKNIDSSRNMDIVKLHPALEDHNYFFHQVQSTSGS